MKIYFGLPDLIIANVSKQFMAKKFKQYAFNIDIIVKNAPVEINYTINMVEYYHETLQQVYFIITNKIPSIKPNLALQRSFKAINNSVVPNRLVSTLLVFGAYFRMTK